ncbi:Solute carrier family 25 member 47-A [Grifola frondosa]|uniref:Solute carrier family 25 member 47-A n=1 Tax=Grifola frondosa TaxID=5627 RepID=A0A1C7LX30_GRIFR|nr:Solute carrier family 25 member 47-A [Grifola frondosa]
MDSWPAVDREPGPDVSKEKGKRKNKRTESPWNYPVVEQGSLGSATLCRKDGNRLEWTFLVENNSGRRLTPRGGPVEILPPTRIYPLRVPTATILQRAEQGAHFLRTYFPDVDIPAELIREEITEDARTMQQFHKYDPYAGNMLESLSFFDGPRKKLAFLAFPMGGTNSDLSISQLIRPHATNVWNRPSLKAVCSFETPIKQIVASSPSSDATQKLGPILGVRTLGSISLLRVNTSGPQSLSLAETSTLLTIARSDIGDRHAVDMVLPSFTPTSAFIVNDVGAVYKCNAPIGGKSVQHVYSKTYAGDPFFRLAESDHEDNLLLISGTNAIRLDLRVNSGQHDEFVFGASGELLTSIESLEDDHMIRLVSTQEILWFDERHTRSLCCCEARRDFDRTLQCRTRVFSQITMTFLTSRQNGLVTIYDVSRADDNLVHLNVAPYSLPPLQIPDARHLGQVLLQHPDGKSDISIFELSERGGISNLECSADNKGEAFSRLTTSTCERSEDIQTLHDDIQSSHTDLGPLGARNSSQVDLQAAYHRLFDVNYEESSSDSDAVYDTLDKMPSFWRDLEDPVEHTLTTFDIALRSGPDPAELSRSDVFTESTLSSTRGYRAVMQGRVPRRALIQQAPWHYDLASFLRRVVPDIQEDMEGTAQALLQYDLVDGPSRTTASFRRESEAREQLCVDLSLSSDVYSPQRFDKEVLLPSSLDDALETMSRATGALTLTELEPPTVQFGFLRPVTKASMDHYSDAKADESGDQPNEESITPLGVRLLLKEWEIGTDPHNFAYQDPYEAPKPGEVMHHRAKELPPAALAKEFQGTQSQRPPLVFPSLALAPPVIASSQPVQPRKPLLPARSYDALVPAKQHVSNGTSQPAEGDWGTGTSSQDFMASTQVVPGPFGGRMIVTKKKSVKKSNSSVLGMKSQQDYFGGRRLTKRAREVWMTLSVVYMSLGAAARLFISAVGRHLCRELSSTSFIRHSFLRAPWLSHSRFARANARNWTVAGPVTAAYEREKVCAPLSSLIDSAALNESLRRNKAVVCALSASYISTFAGYPLDSLKSRLQTTKHRISIPKLALLVYQEEGVIGFYRGLWIPLMTISFVRAASFTIYSRTKEYFRDRHWLTRNNILDVSATGGISGALSGSLISFGSVPFELVKVRRQLEYTIAASRGLRIAKAPSTLEAVRDIFRSNAIVKAREAVRDTTGTALYFFEYDGFRYIMGRDASGEQGQTPAWLPIHPSLVPFMCGSLAGVTSWALIYPLDVVKTKVQQRALAGERKRGILETLHRLIRGPDPNAPKPILVGLARLYQGLGVSAIRSITTHGLLWTFFDLTAGYIDRLPQDPSKT